MFQRVLICTDFSDGLHRLVNFVPSLAASGIQQVIFFHNAPLLTEREIPCVDAEKEQSARKQLSAALQSVPEGIDVRVEVQSGRPIDNILRLAQGYKVDIILLGMPSRSLLNEKLFGSTTMGLSQRTTTPLMTLRPQLISTYTTEELDLRCQHLFRYLLIPYDGSKAARYLVERVKQQAKSHPSSSLEQCLLLWIIEESGRRELRDSGRFEVAEQELRAVKSDLESLGIQVHTDVRLGNRITETLEAAQVYDISAIATSSDSLGKLLEWSVPSFTGEVLRKSWHPVIYFPPGRD